MRLLWNIMIVTSLFIQAETNNCFACMFGKDTLNLKVLDKTQVNKQKNSSFVESVWTVSHLIYSLCSSKSIWLREKSTNKIEGKVFSGYPICQAHYLKQNKKQGQMQLMHFIHKFTHL